MDIETVVFVSKAIALAVVVHLLGRLQPSVVNEASTNSEELSCSLAIPDTLGQMLPELKQICSNQVVSSPYNYGEVSQTQCNGGLAVKSTDSQQLQQNAMVLDKAKQYDIENAEILARFRSLNDEMKRKKIDSFEALAELDKKAAKLLIDLARLTQPMVLEGNNIGIFGLTSAGKSTFLNSMFGMKVAETGAGETTRKITPYPSDKFVLWDVPGRNDEILYISIEYIGFFKGLTRRLILITSTVKENSNLMKLLDAINLQYDIVVNKFDLIDEDERQKVKDQIQREIKTLQLKKVNKVFYLSAKYPQMFPDWLEMVNYLTN